MLEYCCTPKPFFTAVSIRGKPLVFKHVSQACGNQIRICTNLRVARCIVPAAEGYISQVPRAYKPAAAAEQEFAAPNSAVLPQARSIKRHANNLVCDPVFRHDRRDMRMVVLYAYKRQAGFLLQTGY